MRNHRAAMVAAIVLLGAVGLLVTGRDGGIDSTPSAGDTSDGPSGLAVLFIIGSIVVSFVFARWLGRRILRSTQRAGVLESGIATSAVITAMTETGTTVNQHPMVEFGLRITRGTGTYDTSVKQILPRLLLGRVAPGTEVGIRVLPNSPAEVAIDWSTLDGATPGPITERIDTRDFLRTAVPAEAEIAEMSETEMTATSPETGEELEIFSFVMLVHNPGGSNYRASLLQGVPRDHVGRVGPGATVPIGINPHDHGQLAINWKLY